MKTIFACCSILLASQAVAGPAGFVPSEVPTIVEMSNHDINRIVCSGQMSDLIYSEEKGITGHFSGNNAFVKFTAEEINGERVYTEVASEIFVVCNDTVYTLIAQPVDIPSVTLHLASPAKDVLEKNITRFKNMPLEKQALQLIREGYEGVFPESYQMTQEDTPIPLCADLTVHLQKTVDVEGVGLRLKEFRAVSNKDETMDLQEKDFLALGISDAILAVAVENQVLEKGEASRVFVVEKREAVR